MDAGRDTGADSGRDDGKAAEAAACDEADFASCIVCDNTLEVCACVCKFCSKRDGCECALFDAATGG